MPLLSWSREKTCMLASLPLELGEIVVLSMDLATIALLRGVSRAWKLLLDGHVEREYARSDAYERALRLRLESPALRLQHLVGRKGAASRRHIEVFFTARCGHVARRGRRCTKATWCPKTSLCRAHHLCAAEAYRDFVARMRGEAV